MQGDGALTAQAYTSGNALVTKYYYAGSRRVAVRKNGTLHYLLGDHLGSTSITANSSVVREAELRYYAYGETRYTWGDTPTSARFTGQREGDTIGLYFYNARYYDPALGRFVQPDTIVPNPNNPQDFNRYSYVRNNPLKLVDPTGHLCEYVDGRFVCSADQISVGSSQTMQQTLAVDEADTNPATSAYVYGAEIAPPDYDNPSPDGNPPPPQVDGLPDDGWEWDNNWGGLYALSLKIRLLSLLRRSLWKLNTRLNCGKTKSKKIRVDG